jgi:prepilin-type N-terminal cleavage/methylation domain-containing protein
MKQTSKPNAFTLIELLVVISIIAILASIAIPVFSSASLTAQQNKAVQQCKGIFYGLKMFANDHNGIYPSVYEQDFQTSTSTNTSGGAPLQDANQAYANIIPTYVNTEKPFSVPVSRYCKTASGSYITPDDNFTNRQQVLAAGMNAFAYVEGLNDTSNSNYPIMADGFAGGQGIVQSPKYSKTENDFGAVWKGRKAIVVRLDGSVSLESINQQTLVVVRPGPGQMNLFQPQSDPNNPWLVGCQILNPKQPQ